MRTLNHPGPLSGVHATPTAIAAAAISKITSSQAFSAATLAATLTNANFAANRAALVSFADGTYLAVNNGTAGWNAGTDAILRLNTTGNLNNFAMI